jgi:hypothetical protein
MGVNFRVREWIIPIGVFAGALAAYVWRLCPVVGPSDLGEFAVMPAFLAPGHYPGYPLLNQLLYLPHLIDVNPAYCAGLLNAVFAAGAAAVLSLAWRAAGVRPAVGAPLALAFALTPACWGTAASGPEAFGLGALAAAAFIFLSFKAVSEKDARYLLAAVFTFALSIGNHVSFAMFAPLVVAAFFLTGRRGPAVATAVFLVGISVYFHYIMRKGYFGDQYGQDLMITGGRMYGEFIAIWQCGFFTTGINEAGGLDKNVWAVLIFQLKYGILLLVAPGVAAFVSKGREWAVIAAALAAAAVGSFWAYVAYRGFTDEPYLVIPVMIVVTFAALGAEWVTGVLAARWRFARGAVPAVLCAIPLYFLINNYGEADRTKDLYFDCYSRELYKSVPREAAILAEHHVLMPVAYYHSVLARRPDVGVYSMGMDKWEEAPARMRTGDLSYFDEIGSARPRREPERTAYLIDEWPDINARLSVRRLSVPGEFLARAVLSLPPGGRFCAVIGDGAPRKAVRRKNFRRGRTCCWRHAGSRFPLERRSGLGVFLAGRKRKNGVLVFAAGRKGAYDGVFDCPRRLGPPPAAEVRFGWRGDDYRGLSELRLDVGERSYSSPCSGIIFVPLTRDWRPAGAPSYYSDYNCAPFYFYEVIHPGGPGEGL